MTSKKRWQTDKKKRRKIIKTIKKNEGVTMTDLIAKLDSSDVSYLQEFTELAQNNQIHVIKTFMTDKNSNTIYRVYTNQGFPGLIGHGCQFSYYRPIQEDISINTITTFLEGHTRLYGDTDVQKNILSLLATQRAPTNKAKLYIEHDPHLTNSHALVVFWDRGVKQQDLAIGWIPKSISRVLHHHLDQISDKIYMERIIWTSTKQSKAIPVISIEYHDERTTEDNYLLTARLERICPDEP